jgi:HEPN domain-containing protein
MRRVRGGFCMLPVEDASLLLRIIRRHLQAMRLNLDPVYPDEEWGFQAHQALEKLLKARLVLADQLPTPTHEQELQVYAVEARYEEGPFALKTPREELLAELEQRLASLEDSLKR